MSNKTSTSGCGCGTDTNNMESSCDCGTGQTQSDIACPVCRKLGATVNLTTLKNTLIREVRTNLDTDRDYYFCENPGCDVVYYNNQDTSVFTIKDLKNRVTIKDNSPETPLCYCFKVLKNHALEEIARTGSTDVFASIHAKMKPGQSCFCEKANPRGDTCSKDIRDWLEAQGYSPELPKQKAPAASGCCG